MLAPETDRFIEFARHLTPDELAEVFDHMVRLRRLGGKEASRATSPSAAEFSAIDHAVRSALLPRAEELNAFRAGLHSDALSAVMITARAIQKRNALTAEQYEVLVAPFAGAGVDVPGRPA